MAEKTTGPAGAADSSVPGSGDSDFHATPRRIYRSRSDRYFAGVCGGVAEYFGIDSNVLRVFWALAVFIGGTGLLAYIAAWIIIPESPAAEDEPARTWSDDNKRNAGLIIGGILIFIGIAMVLDHYRWRFDFPFFFPHLDPGVVAAVIIIGFGLFLLFRKSGVPDEMHEPATETAGATMTGGSSSAEKRLTRSVTDRKIAGVCGGIAHYFNIDPSLVRLGFVLVGLAAMGLTVVAYIIMMIVVPEEEKL